MNSVLSRLLFLAVCCQLCHGFSFNFFDKSWDGLRVRFGIDPSKPEAFQNQPRTVKEAENSGYTKISSECSGKFRGNRYIKNNDRSMVLLYDVNGYIAGIQGGVPNNQANGFPFPELQPPFVLDGDFYFVTAYFTDPASICSEGRSASRFLREGTGNNLYFQNGANPDTDYIAVPKQESQLGETKWVKGNCFPHMGRHYWYDIHGATNCRKFFPAFLMYNNGELNAFGWAYMTDVKAALYEHPRSDIINTFINDPPQCLYEMGTLSTLHIYLSNRPGQNFC